MKTMALKKISRFLILALLSLSATFSMVGCDNDRDNSSGLPPVFDPFNPNNPYNPNYNLNGPTFYGQAQIFDKVLYRRFLRGDVCWSKGQCKQLDNSAEVFIRLTNTQIPQNQQVFGEFGIGLRTDRNIFFNGGPAGSLNYPLLFRRVNNNTQFEGIVIDRRTKNGIGAQIQVLGSGDPSKGYFEVRINYEGRPMIHAFMNRIR